MKNKLCMLLLASGIGLFSCAEQDLPKEYTDSVNVFILVDMATLSLVQLYPMEWYS